MRKFVMLMAVALALASSVQAATVQVCVAKATTGACASHNSTFGHGQLRGHKTVGVKISGTANVTADCVIGSDASQMTKAIGSAFTSTGTAETDLNCSDIVVTVNSCTSCTVDAWVASEQ